jgi:hypothetical protein
MIDLGLRKARKIVKAHAGRGREEATVRCDDEDAACSGAEDYLEIQRQFDLETRKFEIEKLKCEIDKLKVETQRLQSGEPSMVVQSDAGQSSVNLNITSGETPSGIKIQSPGP